MQNSVQQGINPRATLCEKLCTTVVKIKKTESHPVIFISNISLIVRFFPVIFLFDYLDLT